MPFEHNDDLALVEEPTGEGHTRLKLVRDGVEISGATVVPMTVQIGIAPVRMDGIGGVATDEAHRYKGYSRRVLEACIDFMRRGDAELTTLYGIPSFYPKFGYATLGPEVGVEVRREFVPDRMPESYSARRMQPGDLPAVRSLYAAGADQSIGPLIRADDSSAWRKLEESVANDDDEARVVLDASGEIVAYAWLASWCWWMDSASRKRDDALQVAETFAASPSAADALLVACRLWADERSVGSVQLLTPPDGRVGVAAALRGATISLGHTFEGEYMGRSLDVCALLRALEPELAHRWGRVDAPWVGVLAIDTGGDREVLTLGDGTVSVGGAEAANAVVSLSPGDVARLVFGGFPPRELLMRSGVSGGVADALAELFPQGFPYIYPPDRF